MLPLSLSASTFNMVLIYTWLFIVVNAVSARSNDQLESKFYTAVREELELRFNFLDEDSDGQLSLNEVKMWANESKQELCNETVEEEWKQVVTDARDTVDQKDVMVFQCGEDQSCEVRLKKRLSVVNPVENEKLTKEQFRDLLHPEFSDDPRIYMLIIDEFVGTMDTDDDGKISMSEYQAYLKQSNADGGGNASHFITASDTDHDGYLNKTEVESWLHREADYDLERLVKAADEDANGLLSKDEIVEHSDQFTTLLPRSFYESLDSLTLDRSEL